MPAPRQECVLQTVCVCHCANQVAGHTRRRATQVPTAAMVQLHLTKMHQQVWLVALQRQPHLFAFPPSGQQLPALEG